MYADYLSLVSSKMSLATSKMRDPLVLRAEKSSPYSKYGCGFSALQHGASQRILDVVGVSMSGP